MPRLPEVAWGLVLLPALFSQLIAQQPVDRRLCKSGFLEVVSPDAAEVTGSQCKAVVDQVMAAWRFDAAQMQWSDLAAMEKWPLKLRLLSGERMRAEHHGLFGFANGRDLFVLSTAVLDEPAAQGAVAHE